MDRQMRAILCHDFGDARVENVDRPEPGPGEVLLKPRRVQLSVTECHLYRGHPIRHYEEIKARLAEGPTKLFGHEFCADVAELGEGVEAFAVGDRVYAPGKITCGDCRFCNRGFEAHCANQVSIGYDRPGALAEYFTVPASPLATLPDGVSDAAGTAMQPLAGTVLCVRDAGVETGDVVAVVGAGVMGHQFGQIALNEGASEVHAVDVDPAKLDIAADNGLQPIDATEEDPVAVVRERTDGIGADVVVEAVGGDQADAAEGDAPIAQAFRMVRPGGTVVQVGHIIGDLTMRPRDLRGKSVDWVNPTLGATYLTPKVHSGEHAARLVADGRVSIEEYVTHEYEGLEAFDTIVDVTLDKPEYGALGPAQIVL